MTLPPQVLEAASYIVPLILAIVCHEMAHGLVARALGDDTAARMGRLSFNPLRHVDLVGTILLPGALALTHAPVFGWAKPVPVDARRLHKPRHDMMLVGAAGPASNFVMAFIAAIGIGLTVRWLGASDAVWRNFGMQNLLHFLEINLFVGLFNLLPIPPFDGSHIVEGLLPLGLAQRYAQLRRYGMLVPLLLLVVLPLVAPKVDVVEQLVGPPFDWLARQYLATSDWIAHL